MRLVPRVEGSLDTEDQHGAAGEMTTLESAMPQTRMQVDLRNIPELINTTMKLKVTNSNKWHVEEMSHETYSNFGFKQGRDDVDSLLKNIDVDERLVHQACEEIERLCNSETREEAPNRLNDDSFNSWSGKEMKGIPDRKLETGRSQHQKTIPVCITKNIFGRFTAERALCRQHDKRVAYPLQHQMMKLRVPEPKVTNTGKARYSIHNKRISTTQNLPPRPRGHSSISDTALDKVTHRLYQDDIARKKRINAMILKTREAASLRKSSYSKKDYHNDNDQIRISEKVDELYIRLYNDSKHQREIGVKRNAMILKTREAASFQEASKDPREISEKVNDVYIRPYDDSKHQREVGVKRRVAIAEAIQERRKVEVRKYKTISIAKAADVYHRQMEQKYLCEQKQAELARARGVHFVL